MIFTAVRNYFRKKNENLNVGLTKNWSRQGLISWPICAFALVTIELMDMYVWNDSYIEL